MLNALLDKTLKPFALSLPAERPADDETLPEVTLELRDEAAATLYRFAPLNLAATALVGLTMTLAVERSNPGHVSGIWLTVLLLLTAARVFHTMYWRRPGSCGFGVRGNSRPENVLKFFWQCSQ